MAIVDLPENNNQMNQDSITSNENTFQNSGSWEKVALYPHERVEFELHQLQQKFHDIELISQNESGIDLEGNTNIAAGKIYIKVIQAKGILQTSFVSGMPNLYVSATVCPFKASDGQKSLKTFSTSNSLNPVWDEELCLTGIKIKKLKVKITVRHEEKIVADIFMGEVVVDMENFLNQEMIEKWYDLSAANEISDGINYGSIKLRIKFEYSAKERYTMKQQHLKNRMVELKQLHDTYEKTKKLVKADILHPAAFGEETQNTCLYIPGNQFTSAVFHPAATLKTPFSDMTRVSTVFGLGTILSFRERKKIYSVRLDLRSTDGKPVVCHLQQDQVSEYFEADIIQASSLVTTPYGDGEVVEIRDDESIVVKLNYSTGYLQPSCVKLRQKQISSMSIRELVAKSINLTQQGNEHFKSAQHEEATKKYIQSLAYLQYVKQDDATIKEKAQMLETMIRCHLNIGVCKLKMSSYSDAVVSCTNALNILKVLVENRHGRVVQWMGRLGITEQQLFQDWPCKATYRRGQALFKLKEFKEAKTDLSNAIKMGVNDKNCRVLLEYSKKQVSIQKRKEKKAWGGIFEKEDTVSLKSSHIEQKTIVKKIEENVELKESLEKKLRESQNSNEDFSELQTWYLKAAAVTAVAVTAASLFLILRGRHA